MNSNLRKLGWNEYFQQQFDLQKHPHEIPARITREDRGRYTVQTEDSKSTAQLSGFFRKTAQISLDYPTVGDWVLLEPIENSESYHIQSVFERKSLFTRQASGQTSEQQLLAANVDYLFIVTGLDQEFNPKRLQRYLAQAWNSGAEPVVILNKSDLVEDSDQIVSALEKSLPGTSIHALSAQSGDGLDSLEPYLEEGKTIALSGSSGVGKSSLINALMEEQLLETQANRSHDNRGRHTTTWRELIKLNEQACMIDLPGMRELQLTGEQNGIGKAFSDIKQIALHCRYRNCSHTGEPGCAVTEALESGELSIERYNQFTKLSLESQTARKRKYERKAESKPKQGKWEEKEAFFKDVRIRHKKDKKAKRKFGQIDGF